MSPVRRAGTWRGIYVLPRSEWPKPRIGQRHRLRTAALPGQRSFFLNGFERVCPAASIAKRAMEQTAERALAMFPSPRPSPEPPVRILQLFPISGAARAQIATYPNRFLGKRWGSQSCHLISAGRKADKSSNRGINRNLRTRASPCGISRNLRINWVRLCR
jgi:hypothetical protein